MSIIKPFAGRDSVIASDQVLQSAMEEFQASGISKEAIEAMSSDAKELLKCAYGEVQALKTNPAPFIDLIAQSEEERMLLRGLWDELYQIDHAKFEMVLGVTHRDFSELVYDLRDHQTSLAEAEAATKISQVKERLRRSLISAGCAMLMRRCLSLAVHGDAPKTSN
jgi:hypothetical protein